MALLTRVVSIPDWYSGLAGIYAQYKDARFICQLPSLTPLGCSCDICSVADTSSHMQILTWVLWTGIWGNLTCKS